MTIKSIIEDLFDNAGVSHAYDRESFAAEYARNIRNGTRAEGLPFNRPASGQKPAGSTGWDRGYLAAVQEYDASARQDNRLLDDEEAA